MTKKIDTPKRQLYFGEKPILIEKNWKAWSGDYALLEKNLTEWEKENQRIEKENKLLKEEIKRLNQDKDDLTKNLADEKADRIADKTKYEVALLGKDSFIQQWQTNYQNSFDFTKEIFKFLGDAKYPTKSGSYEMSKIAHLQELLVKVRKLDGGHKSYWTIKDLLTELETLKQGQKAIFDILGDDDVKGTIDIKTLLTYGGKQRTLKEMADNRTFFYNLANDIAGKVKKKTADEILKEIDLLLTLQVKYDKQNISLNQVGNIIQQLDAIFKPDNIKITKVGKSSLSRKTIKPVILANFVNINNVINLGLGKDWNVDEDKE